jgi:1,4-dihydroxy-2-naphthoate octaprenyltransferase
MLSIPIGLLVTNILVVNNLRDLPTDKAAGKRTLAVRMGDRATRMQYAIFTALAYLTPVSLAIGKVSRPFLLLPWVTLPLAIYVNMKVLSLSGRELNPLLKKTGQLLLIYGLLLAIGAALSSPSAT